MIYLDNAASAPLYPEVIDKMNEVMCNTFGNPSAIHSFGRNARVVIEEARKNIAEMLNASPAEIIFTSGGTEANNWAINGCIEAYNINQIITTRAEHQAVLKPLLQAANNKNIPVHFLNLDKEGQFDFDELEKLMKNDNKKMVSLMHGNNETGAILPIKKASSLCASYGAFFMSDMVQTIGKYPFDFNKIKVDFATASAHKFHGPKGVGFLYINSNSPIPPQILGGGQERNLRAGTENIYAIAGMCEALKTSMKNHIKDLGYISNLKAYFVNALKEIEGISFNAGSDKQGLHTILNVSFPKSPQTEMLVYGLDISHIAASGGSACSSGSVQTSHVLDAINADTTRPSIRFSLSIYNTKAEIDMTVKSLKKLLS